MGIEEEQKMMSKPRWRYHWGNHIPLDWIENQRQEDVLLRSGYILPKHEIGSNCFLWMHPLKLNRDVIAYRIK